MCCKFYFIQKVKYTRMDAMCRCESMLVVSTIIDKGHRV
jgi:hypothetical protein